MLRAGALLGLGLLSACASSPKNGGMAAFAGYDAIVEVNDGPNADRSALVRSLHFTFPSPGFIDTPSACASFRGDSLTFAGRPVGVFDTGGWRTMTIPLGTKPGATTTSSWCTYPIVYLLVLDEMAGEPQNAALAIDGPDGHLEVPFHRDFGVPDVSLVSVAADKIVVRLQGFATPPTFTEIGATLLLPASLGARCRPWAASWRASSI